MGSRRTADVLTRRLVAWAFLTDLVPFYPLYALFFTDSGLSVVEISVLFAIWSAVGIVGEVPTGALADRFSRRTCLVIAGITQAAGYASWVLAPTFGGFAIGFLLWGLGGVLASGAREALLYDGLAADGQPERYATVNGWVVSAGLLAEIPTALLATALFALGEYELVGWVSVATCLAAAAVALTLPERRPEPVVGDGADDEPGYLATIGRGIRIAASRRGVLGLLLIASALGSLDALEEYFPLIALDLAIPVALIPLALLPIGLAGAAGAALGGRLARWNATVLALALAGSMGLLALGALIAHPMGIVAIAAFYAIYRSVLIVVDARLQHRIDSSSRATVTSFAGMAIDLMTFAVYAAWILGESVLIAALGVMVAGALLVVLRRAEKLVEPEVLRSRTIS